MIVTVLAVVGFVVVACAVAVVHDRVCRRRRLSALRTWAHEHCIDLRGYTRRELHHYAGDLDLMRDAGVDLAAVGREIALQQQLEQRLDDLGQAARKIPVPRKTAAS